MSTNKTLGDAGLGELIDILKNELANAGSSVPTITIALSQVVAQSPLQIQLTNEQYDALAASQLAVIDATALGFTALMTAVRESSTTTDLFFYARAFYEYDSYVAKVREYSYSVDGNTKILAARTSDFYPIPTVTITADNIDQGTITLTSAQRTILDNNFIVKIDASIAGYPVIQMYKARWGAGDVTFSTAPDAAGYWSYTAVFVDSNNELSLDTRTVSSTFDPTQIDEPISCPSVTMALTANSSTAQVAGITSGSSISGYTSLQAYISAHLPIRINGALCHYMDENTTTNIVRYFTATMNGALVHLNIIEINTSTWVVTFNQVDVGASPNVDQDLTANTCFTLDATAFASLISTHTATVASPVFTGLSNAYEFVTIKASINGTNYNVKLCRNDTSKYSGLFFIEDSSHLYELTVYYNGTSVYLRCATVY